MFKVNEIFRSIQGEGADAGSPAIFVRMAGCNLSCSFCDTEYILYEEYEAESLIEKIVKESQGTRLVVFTGGEPLLQPIAKIVQPLKNFGFYIGLETNGTIETDTGMFNSLSLSPKVPVEKCKIRYCHSLKILYPYLPEITPENYKDIFAGHRFIQPLDNWGWSEKAMSNKNIVWEAAQEVLRLGDGWKLGLQIHKIIDMR